MARLDRSNTILVVIDVQEKLLPVIHDGESLQQNIARLIRGCHTLGVPVIVTEQYVKGLGPTVQPVRSALEEGGHYEPIEKMCFSAASCAEFAEALARADRKQVLIAGVETHVCVYQTATDLLRQMMDVTLIADALSSRTLANKEIALQRMTSEGAKISSTEMALFELTVASGTDEFKAIARLVK